MSEPYAKERRALTNYVEIARFYDAKYTEMGDGWATPADECNRHLDDLSVPFDKTKTLLDVGCGAGHFLAEAVKRVSCWGIDVSPVAIEMARRRIHGNHFSMEPVETFGWPQTFDFIVSMGSLEHVLDLDAALANISHLLAPGGRFYNFAPNEYWAHDDQPNELIADVDWWVDKCAEHGLSVYSAKRWNDQTAYIARHSTTATGDIVIKKPVEAPNLWRGHAHLRLNLGSGQRPFAPPWVNVDVQPRWNPDIVGDIKSLGMLDDGCADMIVFYHSLEHAFPEDGSQMLREVYRLLAKGGSLIVTVPDMLALSKGWLRGRINDELFLINLAGAFMGDGADRHRNWFTARTLVKFLEDAAPWSAIKTFDWRSLEGTDICSDWWYEATSLEAVK